MPDLQPGQIGWMDLTVGDAESLKNFYGQGPKIYGEFPRAISKRC